MSKTAVAQVVKLLVPAGKATPSPPVGPALGARGVKAMDFCKEFNARTAHLAPTTPTPTLITINPDRTFSFTTRSTPVAHLLKLSAGVVKGSASAPSGAARAVRASTSGSAAGQAPSAVAKPAPSPPAPGGKPGKGEAAGSGIVGRVSVKQIYEIAKIKMADDDLKVLGLEKVARGVAGSARSLGLEVVA